MATYSRGLCALSAHACVRAHVIMARIIMAYLVTANKVAAYIVTTKYSYGLYTPCVRTRARIRTHAHTPAFLTCPVFFCSAKGCLFFCSIKGPFTKGHAG